jgi:hypothetical protein
MINGSAMMLAKLNDKSTKTMIEVVITHAKTIGIRAMAT